MISEQTLGRETMRGTIWVDCITYSGSAFALCENGDQVFLNSRIVAKLNLSEGDICHAVMLQNFEDKVNITPWRAVRVDPLGCSTPC